MNKFSIFLTTILVFIIAVSGGIALYIRELRREYRHQRYLELEADSNEVEVTIPEGFRREQIAAVLESKGVTSSVDFIEATTNDEGTLFPDTYRFFKQSPANEVRDIMINNYLKKSPAKLDKESLILASIVEREAKSDGERADIAGVYWNRYNAGLGLTADPTVQYGKDSNEFYKEFNLAKTDEEKATIIKDFDFWGVITRSDYQNVNSTYNTYRNAGLPPKPIANPGVASMQASLNYTDHNYFYFFHTESGETIFSQSLDEHNKNKAKYL